MGDEFVNMITVFDSLRVHRSQMEHIFIASLDFEKPSNNSSLKSMMLHMEYHTDKDKILNS